MLLNIEVAPATVLLAERPSSTAPYHLLRAPMPLPAAGCSSASLWLPVTQALARRMRAERHGASVKQELPPVLPTAANCHHFRPGVSAAGHAGASQGHGHAQLAELHMTLRVGG